MISLQYRTLATAPRQGLWGKIATFLAAHPIWAGLACGMLASGIALLKSSSGPAKMPELALILVLLVVLVWVAGLWLMRGFFASQTTVQHEVVRRIEVNAAATTLSWSEGDTLKKSLDPVTSWSLARAPGAPKSPKTQEIWPLFVIATSPQETFVLETRGLWQDVAPHPIHAAPPDDVLPAHIASPLLELGRAGE